MRAFNEPRRLIVAVLTLKICEEILKSANLLHEWGFVKTQFKAENGKC